MIEPAPKRPIHDNKAEAILSRHVERQLKIGFILMSRMRNDAFPLGHIPQRIEIANHDIRHAPNTLQMPEPSINRNDALKQPLTISPQEIIPIKLAGRHQATTTHNTPNEKRKYERLAIVANP